MLTSSLSYKVVTFFLAVVILLGCLLGTFVIVGKEKRKKFVCFCCCFLTALIEIMGRGFSVNMLFVDTLCIPNSLGVMDNKNGLLFCLLFWWREGSKCLWERETGGMCV